jgi:hypothetical protein
MIMMMRNSERKQELPFLIGCYFQGISHIIYCYNLGYVNKILKTSWLIDLIDWLLVFNPAFSNISAISWRPVLVVKETRRNPPSMGKQLVNFITCGCESSALFFVIYKAGRETTPFKASWVFLIFFFNKCMCIVCLFFLFLCFFKILIQNQRWPTLHISLPVVNNHLHFTNVHIYIFVY